MTSDCRGQLGPQDQRKKSTISRYFSARANFRDIFERKTDRFPALDGIRALSVLLIVFYHSSLISVSFYEFEVMKEYFRNFPLAEKYLFEGHYGVNAFFVLSGFLIGTILMKEVDRTRTIDLKNFYWRRYLRITPLYFFVIAIAAMVWTFASNENPHYLWYCVLYLNNYISEAHDKIPWAWSLAVEEQFYILFPCLLLMVFRFKNRLVILLAIYLSSYLIRALILIAYPEISLHLFQIYFCYASDTCSEGGSFRMLIYIPLWSRFGELLVGVLLAYLHMFHRDKLRVFLQQNIVINNLALLFALVALTWLVSVPIFDVDNALSTEFLFFYNVINENLFSLCVAVIMCCVLYPAGLSVFLCRALSAKFWFPIAQLSYAIYLLHPPFVFFAFKMVAKGSTVPSMGIHLQTAFAGLLITLLFATLTFIFIERPFMRMR